MRLKRIVTLTFLVCAVFSLQAQQQGQYSQYMMNYFLINPAAAGTEDFMDFRAGYRKQWAGLQGAPQNYYASFHLPINRLHSHMHKLRRKQDAYSVMGGMFSGQKLGVLSHNAGYASYAYHLPLTRAWVLSMGAVAGFSQFTVDGLDFGDDIPDPAVNGQNKMNFDMGIGLWLYSKSLFVGVSSMQILQNKVEFSTQSTNKGVLNRHYYITGGYKISLNEYVKVIPSILLKNTATALQVDINTKVRYKDLLWGGMSYRKADAMVFLAGVGVPLTKSRRGSGFKGSGHGHDIRLELGYAYDMTMSDLKNYSNGSHEIMIGFIMPTGGRIISPENYW